MLVEVELREIVQGLDVSPTIVLGGKDGDNRSFPILIGPYEVHMLDAAVHRERAERPLTHDLILNVIDGMGGTLRRVIVDKMTGENYHGKLDVELNDHTRTWIDSRPSDAIILATKLSLPIYVDEDILLQRPPEGPEEEEEEE